MSEELESERGARSRWVSIMKKNLMKKKWVRFVLRTDKKVRKESGMAREKKN